MRTGILSAELKKTPVKESFWYLRISASNRILLNRPIQPALCLRLNDKFNGGSNLVLDGHVGKFGHADHIDAVILQVSSCQHERLHSLVDCSSADGLQLSQPAVEALCQAGWPEPVAGRGGAAYR